MKKPRSHVLRKLAASTLLFAMSACASSAGTSWERGDFVQVQVINDLIPPREVTVSASPSQGGARTMLGSVAPAQQRSFRYRPRVSGADYALMASDAAGDDITSRVFPLGPGDIVVWSLRNNQLELRR